MMWETIGVGVLSSFLASLIISGSSFLFRMILNKKKFKEIIMIMFSKIGYKLESFTIVNNSTIKDVFSYDQNIVLMEIAVLIIGRKKAKRMVEIVGMIAETLLGNATINSNNQKFIADKLYELNDLYDCY